MSLTVSGKQSPPLPNLNSHLKSVHQSALSRLSAEMGVACARFRRLNSL